MAMQNEHHADYIALIYDALTGFYVIDKLIDDINYVQVRAHICYYLQQAIEKCLEALIEYHAVQYGAERYHITHDIGKLIVFVTSLGIDVPSELTDIADELTHWEYEARYLRLGDDLGEATYIEHIYDIALSFFEIQKNIAMYQQQCIKIKLLNSDVN